MSHYPPVQDMLILLSFNAYQSNPQIYGISPNYTHPVNLQHGTSPNYTHFVNLQYMIWLIYSNLHTSI